MYNKKRYTQERFANGNREVYDSKTNSWLLYTTVLAQEASDSVAHIVRDAPIAHHEVSYSHNTSDSGCCYSDSGSNDGGCCG